MKNNKNKRFMIVALSVSVVLLLGSGAIHRQETGITDREIEYDEHAAAGVESDYMSLRVHECGDILSFTTQQYNPTSSEKTELMNIYYHAKAFFGQEYCSCYGDPAMALLSKAGINRSGNSISYSVGKDLEALLLSYTRRNGGDQSRFAPMLVAVQGYLGGAQAVNYKRKDDYDASMYNFDFIDVVELFSDELTQDAMAHYGGMSLHPWAGTFFDTPGEIYDWKRYNRDQAMLINYREFGLAGFRGVDAASIDRKTPTGIDYKKYYVENDYRNMFAMPRYGRDLFDEYLDDIGYTPTYGQILNHGFVMEVIAAGEEDGGMDMLSDMKEKFKCYIYDKANYAAQSGNTGLQNKYGLFFVEKGNYSCPNSQYGNTGAQNNNGNQTSPSPVATPTPLVPTTPIVSPTPGIDTPVAQDPVKEQPIIREPVKRDPVVKEPINTNPVYAPIMLPTNPRTQEIKSTTPYVNPYLQLINQ